MATIHDAMKRSVRQVFGRVEVVYTDPFLDKDGAVSSNQTAYGTTASAVTDMVSGSPFKWFSLQENKLDGSYHPMPEPTDREPAGIWGTVLGDANGDIASPLVLTFTYKPRGIYDVEICGDDQLNEYPVDFQVHMYDLNDVLIHSYTVVDNTSVRHIQKVNVGNVAKITVTVSKVNKPFRSVKIVEIYTVVRELYEGSDLVSIDLFEEQQFDNGTLPIGNISANELDVRILNLKGKFDPRNKTSPLFGLLLRDRPVRAWLGTEINPGSGLITWFPLGKFWTTEWTAPGDTLTAGFTARDRLDILARRDFTKSQVYTNANMYDMALMVLEDVGLLSDEFVVSESLKTVTVPYVWFDRMSHRDALKLIAQASLGRVYCDREGRVVVDTYEVPAETTFDFTEDDYFSIDNPFAWSRIVNHVEVPYSPKELGAQTQVYISAEVIEIPAGQSIMTTIVFDAVPIAEIQPPVITKSADIALVQTETYCWGAVLTFTNNGTVPATITGISFTGKPLNSLDTKVITVSDELSIRDNGRQKFEFTSSPFIQVQSTAQVIANSLLEAYKYPMHDATISSRGHISLALGNKVTAPDYNVTEAVPYIVTRQDINWDGALKSTVTGQRVRSGV